MSFFEDNQYDVVYDKNYIEEGYIIYREDYKTFVKIMRDFGNNYIIFANDEFEDEPDKMDYRPIILTVNQQSALFKAFRVFSEKLNGAVLLAKGDLDLGKTYLTCYKTDTQYCLMIQKDIRHKKKQDYNCAIFQVQDTPDGALNHFYSYLESFSPKEEKKEVKEKMINLKSTKKRGY